MKSVMVHSFSQIPEANIPRSQFNRSHGYKTTFDAGYLVPFFVDEALPGDTLNCRASVFARFATLKSPIMDNVMVDSFFFAVPYRLLWDHWQAFNGEQVDPDATTDYEIPTMTAPAVTGYTVGSLSDYFGIPTGVPGLEHSSLWHRAYNLIWDEWFRDENLQDTVQVDKDDGPDDPADYVLLRRGKRHDYFTSCLPWPQKDNGFPVTIPLGSTAPIQRVSNAAQFQWYQNGNNTPAIVGAASFVGDGSGNTVLIDTAHGVSMDPMGGLVANLNSATAATINQLREAFQIQRLYERDARGGTRYTEIVRSHFGVVSPDARLQRPEYLGGGTSSLNVHTVPQTSSTDVTSPQANLAAYGTSSFSGHGFVKSFTEHCIIIGMICARADLNYQQGLNRMFSRVTRWDHYWPALAHLGEQAVLNKEIYAQGPAVVDGGGLVIDEKVFGYQERFAEYRYKPSVVTGKFRSSYAQSLDIWHLAQDFGSLPALDDVFIQENPPIDRVIVVDTEPHFLLDAYFNYKCARPMPTYAVPGLIDHL